MSSHAAPSAPPPSSPPAAAEPRWLIGDVAEAFGITSVHASRIAAKYLTAIPVGRHGQIATYDPAEVRELAHRRGVQAAVAAGRSAARTAERRTRRPARDFYAAAAALNAPARQ